MYGTDYGVPTEGYCGWKNSQNVKETNITHQFQALGQELNLWFGTVRLPSADNVEYSETAVIAYLIFGTVFLASGAVVRGARLYPPAAAFRIIDGFFISGPVVVLAVVVVGCAKSPKTSISTEAATNLIACARPVDVRGNNIVEKSEIA